MGLLSSPRLLPGDREAWNLAQSQDLAWAATAAFERQVDDAAMRLLRWSRQRQGYVGVSWGKDSMVVAHLATLYAPSVPLVWVRVEPVRNPDCLAVRDAFLRMHPARYDEIEIQCPTDADGTPHARGTLEAGFGVAAKRYGDQHISGIRRSEAGRREMYFRVHGGETDRTLAPIIRWSGDDVFAYLAAFDLPVHPVYAMSLGGVIPRERLRVSSLRGRMGTEMGRREWEDTYYPECRHWD